MNSSEAVAAGLTCDVVIAWAEDAQGRRYTLRHLEYDDVDVTLCGRPTTGAGGPGEWRFEALGLRALVEILSRREGTGLCSVCVRHFLERDFAEGQVAERRVAA